MRASGRGGWGASVEPGVVALVGAMGIWGGTYVVTKIALPNVGPFTILLVRLSVGTAFLLPFAWRQGYRPRMSLQKTFVLFGFTGMVLHLGLEILGLRFTSASSAVLIIATAPAVTAVFSVIFLRERLVRRQLIGIALSIAGVVLITGAEAPEGYPLAWLGSLLVFGGVVAWAIFTVQGKRMSLKQPWLVSTTAATAASILLTIPLAAGEIALEGTPRFTASSIAALAYLAIGAQAVAYGLWNLALRHVDASVAGPYVNLVPVIGVGLGLLSGETLTALQIAGGSIVAAGVALGHRPGVQTTPADPIRSPSLVADA